MTTTYGGRAIFGDEARLTAARFVGDAADQDALFGLDEGTTAANPCQRGPAVLLLGYAIANDTDGLAAARAALDAEAALEPDSGTADLVAPTGESPEGWDTWSSAWFAPSDIAWDPAPTEDPDGGLQLAFKLLMHTSGRQS